MKRCVLSLLLCLSLTGCGSGEKAATCAPCGDGAIVCTSTVAECVSDGLGICSTKLGATEVAALTLKGDGTYNETSSGTTTEGTWVDMGTTIVLSPTSANGNVKVLISVYQNGTACPY